MPANVGVWHRNAIVRDVGSYGRGVQTSVRIIKSLLFSLSVPTDELWQNVRLDDARTSLSQMTPSNGYRKAWLSAYCLCTKEACPVDW